ALPRSGVDPLDDRCDFFVGQRRIVLVFLDADGLVDEPRRHLTLADALLDGLRPGPGFAVGEQRHRRDFVGAMAPDAGAIEDRRDVLGERRTGRRGWRS